MTDLRNNPAPTSPLCTGLQTPASLLRSIVNIDCFRRGPRRDGQSSKSRCSNSSLPLLFFCAAAAPSLPSEDRVRQQARKYSVPLARGTVRHGKEPRRGEQRRFQRRRQRTAASPTAVPPRASSTSSSSSMSISESSSSSDRREDFAASTPFDAAHSFSFASRPT